MYSILCYYLCNMYICLNINISFRFYFCFIFWLFFCMELLHEWMYASLHWYMSSKSTFSVKACQFGLGFRTAVKKFICANSRISLRVLRHFPHYFPLHLGICYFNVPATSIIVTIPSKAIELVSCTSHPRKCLNSTLTSSTFCQFGTWSFGEYWK